MDQVESAAEAQLKRLQEELERDPRHRKVAALKRFLADYRGQQAASAKPPETQNGSEENRCKLLAMALLNEHGPTRKASILGHIQAAGLMNMAYPDKRLGTWLARWPEFASDGRGTWTLVGWKPDSRRNEIPRAS